MRWTEAAVASVVVMENHSPLHRSARSFCWSQMTVLEHLRQILSESIEPLLADIGIALTGDQSGYTIDRYNGRKNNFEREVTVVCGKWWSKNRGRFTIFLIVRGATDNSVQKQTNGHDWLEINLGYLMENDTQDWKIWTTDDAQAFVDILTAGMKDYGIPWLERLSTDDCFDRYLADEQY